MPNVGTDTMTGGSGSDRFVGTADQLHGDRITDFEYIDSVILKGVRIRTDSLRVSEQAGPVLPLNAANTSIAAVCTLLQIDTNGNGSTDSELRFDGALSNGGTFQATPSGPHEEAFSRIVLVPNSVRRIGPGVPGFDPRRR